MAELLVRLRRSYPYRWWRRFSAAGPNVLAAAVAFNLFFALVPAALAGLAGASFFGRDDEARQQTLEALQRVAPKQVAEFISEALAEVSDRLANTEGAVIAVALVVALWSASRGVITLQRVLRRIEGMEEDRPWWRVRITGIVLTLGSALALVFSSVLIVAGDWIAHWLEEFTGQDWLRTLWQAARFPVGTLGLFAFLVALYRWGPPRPLPGSWLAALLAGLGMLVASFGFRTYLSQAGALGGTIAIAGAVAVLLLWLYVLAYVMIIAAAIAATAARRRQRRKAGEEEEEEEAEQVELGLEGLEDEVMGEVETSR